MSQVIMKLSIKFRNFERGMNKALQWLNDLVRPESVTLKGKLEPCPFCGCSQLMTVYYSYKKSVRCYGCDATGPAVEHEENAVELWNMRAKKGRVKNG